MTGYSGTNPGYGTIKYDSDGNQLWAARYDRPQYGIDQACAMAVDGSGNVYVSGLGSSAGNNDDYALIKYDSDGNQLWVARYDGPEIWFDQACAIALDDSGNVYMAGSSASSAIGYGFYYVTIKYSQ